MGECQSCLNTCIKKQTEMNTSKNSIYANQRYVSTQIVFSNTLLTIQSKSIAQLDVDILLIFVDRPQAVFNNPFIQKLKPSTLTILSQKITKMSNQNGRNQARMSIIDPFYDIPVKRLLISTIKVWDGVRHHDRYLKNVIESQIIKASKSQEKVSIAVMELDQKLGYNLKDFYKILMRKLREHTQKFNYIVYITTKRQQIEKFITSDFPASKETDSNISQASVYY